MMSGFSIQVTESKAKKPAEFESMRVPARAYEKIKAEKHRREAADPNATVTLGGIVEDAIAAMQASPIPPEHRALVDQLLRVFEGEPRNKTHARDRRHIEEILADYSDK